MDIKILNDSQGIGKEELFNVIYKIESQWSDSMAKDVAGLRTYTEKIYDNAYVIGLVEEEILGVAAVYVNDKETKKAYLTYIALIEENINKGFGTLLLKRCEEIAKDKDMHYLKLEVKNSNSRAISFYVKNNYKNISDASKVSMYMEKFLG